MSAEQAVKPNPEKDLSDWTTGDEAMLAASGYLCCLISRRFARKPKWTSMKA
jgi:hypothetical protein